MWRVRVKTPEFNNHLNDSKSICAFKKTVNLLTLPEFLNWEYGLILLEVTIMTKLHEILKNWDILQFFCLVSSGFLHVVFLLIPFCCFSYAWTNILASCRDFKSCYPWVFFITFFSIASCVCGVILASCLLQLRKASVLSAISG